QSPVPQASARPADANAADAPPRSYADFSRPMTAAPAQPAVAAPAASAAAVAVDPNALDAPPRSYRDFSRPMSAPARPASTGGEAPRTYSVHREYGRQPEHPAMPEPVYLDQLGPSEDLAAPPPPTMSARDERRARSAAADPDGPAPGQ
ncbi:MAG: hypothetical protein K1X35_06250, partial [Caulobacteraceae bacterium]|nr:hypothetical protein [Caulobacteraceae bacterium]